MMWSMVSVLCRLLPAAGGGCQKGGAYNCSATFPGAEQSYLAKSGLSGTLPAELFDGGCGLNVLYV